METIFFLPSRFDKPSISKAEFLCSNIATERSVPKVPKTFYLLYSDRLPIESVVIEKPGSLCSKA